MEAIAHVKIISENELIREGIKRIISEEGIETSSAVTVDLQEVVDLPNYVFLVESDQEKDGLEICKYLRANASSSRIVLMCADFTIDSVRRGFEDGVNGFITRKTGYSALMCKLSLIVAGEKVLPVSHLEAMLSAAPTPTGLQTEHLSDGATLSEREIGILECLVNGDANKMISRRLNIAEPTVKVHVKSILRKLQLSNRTQAAIWAINQRRGLPRTVETVQADTAVVMQKAPQAATLY
jgi:two-component system, NarL family, nitrate/nitrite response regulator NarL